MLHPRCNDPEGHAHALSEQSSVGPNDGCLRHRHVCHCRAPRSCRVAATGAPDPSLISHYNYMRNSRLNLNDEDGLFSLPGVIRDDLRPFDPLDGTALQNRTRITR